VLVHAPFQTRPDLIGFPAPKVKLISFSWPSHRGTWTFQSPAQSADRESRLDRGLHAERCRPFTPAIYAPHLQPTSLHCCPWSHRDQRPEFPPPPHHQTSLTVFKFWVPC
jgi:hypothetical protein